MIQLRDFAGSRSLNWVFGVSFAGLLAVIAVNAASLLFAVPEIASFVGANTGGAVGDFVGRVRTSHPILPLSNIVICILGLFVVLMLKQALRGAQLRKIISVENARRIAIIAALLFVMELIGSLAGFYIFDDRVTWLKAANYIGIGCIFVLAYVLFRAAKAHDHENITV